MDPTQFSDLNTSARILLGPGPSMAHPRVLRTMATPLIGHLDPEFLKVMDDVQKLLRYVFQTENELTIPVSGTGSAAMEAALCNFIEPGDRVLIAVNGYFGERLCDMAGRYGAEVDRIDRPWGEVFDPDEFETALRGKSYKLVALVHAETSTGAWQPEIKEIAAIAHRHGALIVLDTVTSLGGIPVEIDAWDIDVAYSGSQKCLSCPPGLAPLTIGPRARDVLVESYHPGWELVSGSQFVDSVLGGHPDLPPHGANHDELCTTGRFAPGCGGRFRESVCTPQGQCCNPLAGFRVPRPAAFNPAILPPAHTDYPPTPPWV